MSSNQGANIKVNRFWSKFQNFIGGTVPELLIKILISAGYDNAIPLSNLDEDDIVILEAHTTTKLKELIKKNSLYSEVEPFQFLPGHKKTILNLRVKAEQFLENKKKTINSEEVELLTAGETDQLKENLLKRLNAFKLKKQFEEDAIVSSIDPYISHNSRHSRKKASYKCSIKCVHCDTVIPTTYNGHWEVCNIDRHIKSHIKKNPELALPSQTSNKENQSSASNTQPNLSQISINNASNNVTDEVNDLLGLK